MKRRLGFLLLFVVVLCSITAGTWYYRSKHLPMHGMNASAAADAESHERDKPKQTQ